MGYYLDHYSVEALLDGEEWADITGDVIENIECQYGIQGNAPTDRVADIGSMAIVLNNTASNSVGLVGYYTPGHPNCRSGFGTGLDVRLRIQHNNAEIIKFQGKIPPQGIQPGTGRYAAAKTRVTVLDWMEQAANHYLTGMELLEDATAEDGIRGVIENMDAQPPGSTSYYDMESTFPTVFDTVRARTTALSEMAKLVHSELGFLYLTPRGLVVEGRFTRTNQLVNLSYIPRSTADSGALHSEDGDYLVTEDDAPLIADQGDSARFDNAQRDMDVSYGKHLYNSVRFTAYPRRVDAASVLLFELQNPIQLAPGAAATVSGRYRDPSGGAAEVSGIDMVTPVADTHYKMWTAREGTGTDITADLDIDVTFGTGGFTAQVENTGTLGGWITKLELYGRGVYLYDTLEYMAQNQASITRHGISALLVDMKYQNDPIVASAWSEITLSTYKDPRLSIDRVVFTANRSKLLLGAFVHLEPGALVQISEEVTGISSDRFFVQAEQFSISPGGAIEFAWTLREAGVDSYAFWQLGVPNFSNLDRTTRLNL